MRVYTNPIDLARAWEKRADLYKKGIHEIHEIIIRESFKDMVGLLSGNIKDRVLRQMGHPFARGDLSIKGRMGGRNVHFTSTKMRGVSRSYKRKYLGLYDLHDNKRSIVINSLTQKSKLYDPEMAKLVGPKNSQLTRKGNLKVFPINQQTGELINSLTWQDVAVGSDITTKLFSTSPHQVVMTPGGTKYMVDRKIFGEFGMLRRFHKARLSGITRMFRTLNKRIFP